MNKNPSAELLTKNIGPCRGCFSRSLKKQMILYTFVKITSLCKGLHWVLGRRGVPPKVTG
jgi:hypothetical protein